MSTHKISILLLVISVFLSCKKNQAPPTPSKIQRIYVAGAIAPTASTTEPALWMNSYQTTLPNYDNTAEAAAVAVNGTDVYVAGYSYINTTAVPPYTSIGVATYWKNGARHVLDSTANGWTTGIFINNNDVYITGTITPTGYPQAVCWKNGVKMLLQFDPNSVGSEARGVSVYNNDVYVVGNTFTPGFYGIATYWKNGQEVTLNNPYTTTASATAIAANGNDVYVVGMTGGLLTQATIWKNGIASQLEGADLATRASSIQIHNNDVYVAGSAAKTAVGQTQNFLYSFIYWKNGFIANPNWYDGGDAFLVVGAMAVTDADVFVAGTYYGRPAYWDNGQVVHLTQSLGSATGIAVVRN